MSAAKISLLPDRGVVSVAGGDARKLLQGLVTNDLDASNSGPEAIHAGLLSPQGKILFDFFIVKRRDGFLLDVAGSRVADFVKRLTMYKLRADVNIKDVSSNYLVMAGWGESPSSNRATMASISFADPRTAALGQRAFVEKALAFDVPSQTSGRGSPEANYHAHRISLGVPEGGKDYDFGDAYPHEADFDLFNGVSFTKGCYVGQEVVARMQNKTIVRKRVVKVAGNEPLTSCTEILLGRTPIGRIGSVDSHNALAMLRLDRALDALDEGIRLTANGIALDADPAALERYRASAHSRPAAPGSSS